MRPYDYFPVQFFRIAGVGNIKKGSHEDFHVGFCLGKLYMDLTKKLTRKFTTYMRTHVGSYVFPMQITYEILKFIIRNYVESHMG